MKRFLGLTAILISLIPATAAAQANDASVWMKIDSGKVYASPWYIYSGEKINIEGRYNFDAPDTTTLLLGKTKKFGNWGITPQIGGLFGDYRAVSAQVTTTFMNEKGHNVFALFQVANGVGYNFTYHYGMYLLQAGSNVSIGAGTQFYSDSGTNWVKAYDIGPAVRFSLKAGDKQSLYLLAWPTFGKNGGSSDKKFYIAIGAMY